MSYARVQYPGDGATELHRHVPVHHDRRTSIVRVDGVLKVENTDYTWLNATTIQFVTAPAVAAVVDIERSSDRDERLVNHQDASTVTEATLDQDANQLFYIAQEAFDAADDSIQLATDGTFDAESKRIKNVSDPAAAQDAATKNYVDLTLIGVSPATPLAIASGGTGQAAKAAAFNALSPNTTKGDVTVYNGTANIRVGVGANKAVLTADSTQASGVKWDATTVQQTGALVWVIGNAALPGTVKLNGALLSRVTFADLWAYAQASGNLAASDAAWTASALYGQFSPGDGSTTFRVPDARGYFIRAWDDSRGVDAARAIGTSQVDDLKPHTHTGTTAGVSAGHTHPGPAPGPYNQVSGRQVVTGAGIFADLPSTDGSTPPNTGGQSNDHTHTFTTASTGTTESRPKNLALLACIKY
jgi:hypothetical protein